MAPPLNVLSEKPLLPVVLPPVSVSPASVKSPVVAVMLKIREALLASIVTFAASALASIVSASVICSSAARLIVWPESAAANSIVSAPTSPAGASPTAVFVFAARIASRRVIPPSGNALSNSESTVITANMRRSSSVSTCNRRPWAKPRPGAFGADFLQRVCCCRPENQLKRS